MTTKPTRPDAAHWIETLALQPHPEGGFFRETYRSDESVPHEGLPVRFDGPRALSTAIYYLLEGEDFSALHRIRADEVWHFYAGDPLLLEILTPTGDWQQLPLGGPFGPFQAVVGAGHWFGARLAQPGGYALVGCTVAPGFSFTDLEMAKRAQLLEQYPQQREGIERMTRTEG